VKFWMRGSWPEHSPSFRQLARKRAISRCWETLGGSDGTPKGGARGW
jgi:hypothetical protein